MVFSNKKKNKLVTIFLLTKTKKFKNNEEKLKVLRDHKKIAVIFVIRS